MVHRDFTVDNALRFRGDTEETLVLSKEQVHVRRIESLLFVQMSKSPHFVANNAVDAIAADQDVTTDRGAIIASDSHSIFAVVDFCDLFLQFDLGLVVKIVVHDTQRMLSIDEERRVIEPSNNIS